MTTRPFYNRIASKQQFKGIIMIDPISSTGSNTIVDAEGNPIKPPVTACKVLELMLAMESHPRAADRRVGMTITGKAVFIPSSWRYDEDSNLLIRAQAACQLGLVQLVNHKGKAAYVDEKTYYQYSQEKKPSTKEKTCVLL